MRKILITSFILLLLPVFVFAQTQVKAEDIIKQINEGKTVKYENVTITGDLDFTQLDDITEDDPRGRRRDRTSSSDRSRSTDDRSRRSGTLTRIISRATSGNYSSTNSLSCNVKVPVSFINCIFKGDVIGYYSDERENEIYNVVFHEDADFTGTEFSRFSEFKYAKFYKEAKFKGATFNDIAFFKYAEFSTPMDFTEVKFDDDADFKYAFFPDKVDFTSAYFRKEAIFKYTVFPEGVSFEKVNFRGHADFKYAQFYEPLNFDETEFRRDPDFKNTKINGRDFTMFWLRKKR